MSAIISWVRGELERLEELILIALHKSGSIPASVAGTGFWKSISGALQPTASIGRPGQIPKTNSVISDITWAAEMGSWVTVSGTFTPANEQTVLLVDTSGPQATINMPSAPYDGQNLIVYDYEGLAATNPIRFALDAPGTDPTTTIDDPSNPGTTPGATGHIAQQGQTAWFKYFAAAKQWQLVTTSTPYVPVPNSWAQATWFIDQSNKSGVASDSNTGTARGAPLLTYKELVRRWGGTTSPYLSAATCTITFMSGTPSDTDSAVIAPYCVECAFRVTCDSPTIVATGTLSGVVANNITTNQALNAVLPAGTVAGSLIVNTSRSSSIARAFKNLGGNTWQISQPINPPTLPTTASPVQNNAWANGDTVNIFPPATNVAGSTTLFNVNINVFKPRVVSVDPAFTNIPTLANINVGDVDPNGFGFDPVALAMGCSYVNVSFARIFQLDGLPSFPFGTSFIGCDFSGSGIGGFVNQSTALLAGSWRTNSANWPIAVKVDCGFMCFGTLQPEDVLDITGIGTVYVDGGFLRVSGDTSGQCLMRTTYNGNQPAVYGSGGIDSRTALIYANSATLSFPCAGGMVILGVGTAYSVATSAGTSTWHNLALNPTNVDAAAGATGFGGYAVWPNVGCFTRGIAQT